MTASEPTSVNIRGVDYASIKAAAKAHGVAPNTIRTAMKRGTLRNVGSRGAFSNDPVVVLIRGVTYPSISAAARALNVPPVSVSKALDRGDTSGVGLGRNHKTKKPLIVDGTRYESIADAARALGVGPSGLTAARREAIKKGRTFATYKGLKLEWRD